MLYLQNQLTQKEIAKKVDVSEKTMSKWANDEHWETMRKSLMTSKSEMLAFLYDVLSKLRQKINEQDGIGDSKTADMVVKYTASIKSLETETSIAELMEAGKLFHKHLQQFDPQLAMTMLNHYDGFIKERIKQF